MRVAVRGRGSAFSIALFAVTTLGLMSVPVRDASAAPTIIKDVSYRTVNGITLKLDVYEPAGAGPFPGLVFIYGGKYWANDKCGYSKESKKFASVGFTVYSINYRLAPRMGTATTAPCSNGTRVDISHRQGFVFRAGVDDAAAAVQWVRDNGSQYKTDVSKVSVLGSSSGANFAYMLGAMGIGNVQVGWSGPTRLTSSFSKPINENYIGCKQSVCPQTWTAASPYYQVTDAASPAAIYHASGENLPLSMANDYDAALTDHSIFHAKTIVNTSLHGVKYQDVVLPNGRKVWQDTADFIKANQ